MNFKFIGSIDCNTEIVLKNITHDEYVGIEKFITALRNADCSYVKATTSISGSVYTNNKILEPGTILWFIEPLDIITNTCLRPRFKSSRPQKPIEHKILQVIINKDKISYQMSGNGLHINQDMIGKIAFTKYEDAIEKMR